ncbi:MAG TPA: hypothetical protein PLW13_02895 [Pseudomonadales bacterium]|nr:hypothetical protein [Pseudomonadales bacterium]
MGLKDKKVRVIGWTLIPIAALVLCAIFYAAIDRVDTFYVNDSDLHGYAFYLEGREASESYEDSRTKNLPVHAHRIYAGSGTVIGYRKFSNGSLLAVDDEGYEKLTLWLEEPIPEGESIFDLASAETAIVAYAQGGSAWPMHGCFGLLKSGRLQIKKIGTRAEIEVAGEFVPSVRVEERDTSCVSTQLKYSFFAARIEFGELTPWLGMPSDSAYDETYR